MKLCDFTLNVNGQNITVTAQAKTPLLYILRNDLELNGPKFGCGFGECGACAILLDNQVIRSCVTPLAAVGSGKITTLEGLGNENELHPVQQAFITHNAAQCGYCLNGMIIAITALSINNNNPDDNEIKIALRNHLCRCGTHVEIMAAARAALDAIRNKKEKNNLPDGNQND